MARKGEIDKFSFRQRIAEFINKKGREVTVSEVIAAFGKEISASIAISTGRKKIAREQVYQSRQKSTTKKKPKYKLTKERMAERGRVESICSLLTSLVRDGFLRRVRRGVYASLIKWYDPSTSNASSFNAS